MGIILLFSLLSLQTLAAAGHNMYSLQHTGILAAPTTLSGTNHPCYRECGDRPMTCEYNFTVGVETSMGLLCKDCPLKVDDCSLPGCIAAGGLVRTVIAANGQLPGPAILVCENDSVVVNVMNAMSTRSTTIHWHGINQRTTPYSDGVPYVTQCPIEPYTTFRYQFSAFPAGTHVWHGHSGYQEADGLFGQLVVRRKEPKEVESLYDYDLPEHTITVWHWFREQASVILPNNFRTAVETTGYALLINGKGSIKEFMVPNNPDEFAFTPREKFYVKQGFRYRFRLIFNSAVFCPIQVSVDNHTITAFASESSTFEPVEVDSIVLTAGERYDFVVNANQEVSCYWMRFRGFGDCTFGGLMVHEEASLCYYGTQQPDVHISTNYIDGERAGKLLNPISLSVINYSGESVILLPDLKSGPAGSMTDYATKPDVVLYVALRMHNFRWFPYFGPWYQMNNVSFEMPGRVLLTDPSPQANDDNICTDETVHSHCTKDFCSCRYLNKVPLNSLVEMVLVDVTENGMDDHPMHLHGHQFHVVAMEALYRSVTLEEIKTRNENGNIRKNLDTAVAKDTVTVPARGYTVLRFRANNPGYWFFHCHLTKHVDLGMAMVLQVGGESDMAPLPKHVRTCSTGNIPVQDALFI